ncbi:MAG: hypothetical protein NW224_24615 [Leptolyngbyaceae cyanobacterium bins.302]|nr:hypothetical protein [Leptolyngbyaceae cyanobacterium bins.302]
MTVSVQYNLTGRGSSECIVEIDNQQAHLTASYLSDALADLISGVVALVQGADEVTVSFIEEPGEYTWQFKHVSQDRLCVHILWFDEMRKNKTDVEGELVLAAECRLRTFAGAVLSASQRVLLTHGLDGYCERWVKHEFPLKLQIKLQKALKTAKGS